MIAKYLQFILIFTLSLLGASGDYFLKKAGLRKLVDWKFLLIGAVLYALTVPLWFSFYRRYKFSTAGFFYGVALSILLLVLGVVVFKEQVSTSEKIGIVFALISFVLLSKIL